MPFVLALKTAENTVILPLKPFGTIPEKIISPWAEIAGFSTQKFTSETPVLINFKSAIFSEKCPCAGATRSVIATRNLLSC